MQNNKRNKWFQILPFKSLSTRRRAATYDEDNFKSRRWPIYVDVKPRPTLVMPTARQTKLYANRTRTLTVVVPPAAGPRRSVSTCRRNACTFAHAQFIHLCTRHRL